MGLGFQNGGSVNTGTRSLVRVTAADDVGVQSLELLVDGVATPLDERGQFFFEPNAHGPVVFEAIATDGIGNVGRGNMTVQVVDPAIGNQPIPDDPGLPPHPGFVPGDSTDPFVEITSPAPASTISNVTPIIGTVTDENLWYYRVIYARADQVSITNVDVNDPDWIVLNESTQEVVEGELAVFDPAIASNDPYVVAVTAYDVNGNGFFQPTVLYVEGNVQLNNFRLDFTDLSIPLAGIPIEVTRVYDTVNAGDEGDFGFGWRLGVQDARILEVAGVAEGGVFNPGNNTFAPDQTKVYLTNPSGQRVGFTYKEELLGASFFGAVWRPYFEPDPGVYDTLEIDETQVARGGLIGNFSQGINPSLYTLTTKDGLKYRYSETDGLQTITDLNDNVATFTDDGISHSSGEEIQFVRDHRDRITEIVDASGNSLVYEYDSAGDLVSFTNQAGLRIEYQYLDSPAHYLDEATDPLGRRTLKAVYEENPETGQFEFKGVVDAAGNRIDTRDFDTDSNRGVILDANGNETILVYDERGNVLTETDDEGNVTTREYNDPDNPDLETRIIDRRGNITDREYDPRGNLLTLMEVGSESEPLADPILTQFTYDTGNRVTSITNGDNQSTLFTYDASGNLTRIVNADGNESLFTYDDQGRRTSFTDFNQNTTEFAYESGDQPTRVTFADGSYQVFQYNGFGQVTLEEFYESDDTVAERRRTTYDASGRIIDEISGDAGDPDHPQTIVRKIYDGHLLDWEVIILSLIHI